MKTPTRSRSSSGSSKECINNSLEVSLPALKASRYCDTPFLLGPVLSLALTDSSAYFFWRVSFTVRAFRPPGHVLLYERSHFPSPLTPCARGLSQKRSNTYSTKCCKRKPRSPLQVALEMAWSWKPALDHVSSTRSSNGRPCVCDLISVPNPADPKNLEN